ncbi:MAG TPA: ABC transporter substrate-binding protein [Candidatus Thiothrix moscowensis]|uniref:ABC transporter substrate-binding protein n=1 Tax=unclassified Thiothrix TaxID=2636184 RepID=UPI0025FCFE84|nr:MULTISPECIES: transporter substrate-binding domain-containing protein [unclassified Thiothrix]HRJ52666.1 ABC transporter substrate-binding protein [Candidatus Thiothrix moscowensis]HRJ92850.1 ABC transporter substrate-binding protein [Candidatus Thiothrix moscowensis]
MQGSFCHYFVRWLLVLGLLFGLAAPAVALEKIRVGVLEFGTVSWEMDTVQHHKLAEQQGVELEVVPLASADASTVALQGGAVDVIVSDWVWVNRQRAAGQDYTLFPYSNSLGSLMVKADSPIKTLADLKGKKLGIAGGANDKSWLLLRAYARQQGLDLPNDTQPQYAAPPLLNELLEQGELDAVLNFWNFAARLQAKGMRSVISVADVVQGLGIKGELPLVGWVFSKQWAAEHQQAMQGFLTASYAAKKLLKDDDAEWQRLRPRMKADDEAVFTALRDSFRAGIPACFGDKEKQAATDTFRVLSGIGGSELVGEAKALDAKTFWAGFSLPACP